MATDFPLPISGEMGVRSPSLPPRPIHLLRSAIGALIPAVLDLCCIFAACIFAILFYELHRPLQLHDAWLLWAEFSCKYGLAFIILAQAQHLYAQRATLLQVADTARVLRVSVYGLILLSVANFFTKAEMPRLLLAYFWTFATLLVVVQKYSSGRLMRDWRSPARQRRVLLCGTNWETRRLFSYLLQSPHLGQLPVGFLDESGFDNRRIIYSHDYNLKDHVPVISEPLSHSLLRALNVQEIFITQTVSQRRMRELLALAATAEVRVSLVGAGHPNFAERSTSVQMIDGLMVTSFDAEGEPPFPYMAFKRCLDVVMSSMLIVMTLPMWLLVALSIRLDSRGPVFFRQERTGQSGRQFVMLKFRSMVSTAPKFQRSPESASDDRITRVGRLLRKTSLDELPQLLNVLKGDMSLVGPRPEMPYVTDAYTALERRRLTVPQGLTGLWQLSGDRKFVIHEAIEYDLYYIENRGIFLDFAILLHTLFFSMKGV